MSTRIDTSERPGGGHAAPQPRAARAGARQHLKLGLGTSMVLVACIGFAFGALTAYAQGWLPHAIGPLTNSSGPWAIVAFGLAFLATGRRAAALYGATALGMLLVGYVVASEARTYTASHALILFWGAAALVLGPLLGLAGFSVKTERGALAGVGAGAIAGILAGEGIYGLLYVADTTYPGYWWAEIALSALLLGATATYRRWRARVVVGALGVSLLTATLFVLVYREDLLAAIH